MTVIAKRAIVRGRVQGVWFRAWTVEQARALRLAGWVRNRSNGDVEALIEGEAEAVERMIGLLWDGPPAAKVEAVDIIDQPVGAFTAFEQLPTG